jgi:hypothetical protein
MKNLFLDGHGFSLLGFILVSNLPPLNGDGHPFFIGFV